jgi:hypothetical protein
MLVHSFLDMRGCHIIEGMSKGRCEVWDVTGVTLRKDEKDVMLRNVEQWMLIYR